MLLFPSRAPQLRAGKLSVAATAGLLMGGAIGDEP
jgi:hypothetical protein